MDQLASATEGKITIGSTIDEALGRATIVAKFGNPYKHTATLLDCELDWMGEDRLQLSGFQQQPLLIAVGRRFVRAEWYQPNLEQRRFFWLNDSWEGRYCASSAHIWELRGHKDWRAQLSDVGEKNIVDSHLNIYADRCWTDVAGANCSIAKNCNCWREIAGLQFREHYICHSLSDAYNHWRPEWVAHFTNRNFREEAHGVLRCCLSFDYVVLIPPYVKRECHQDNYERQQ